MTCKHLHEVTKIIKAEGLEVLNVQQQKHLKITVSDGSAVFKVMAASSPSDRNALKAFRKRLLRLIESYCDG